MPDEYADKNGECLPLEGRNASMKKTNMEEDPKDYACGLGSWTPDWLQKYATSKCYMVVYGTLGSVQAMAFIYFISTLTTIEKRFGIQSKVTGWMLSGNEVSQILLSLILSFYGGQRNRPVWIAWGVILSAMSCFILASPHLFFGSGPTALALTEEYGEEFSAVNTTVVPKSKLGMCRKGDKPEEDCDLPRGDLAAPLFIFLSQFVLGIGTTLYYSLGQPYLDDSSKKSNTPMLLGSSMSMRLVGTMFSFGLVYLCLVTYINPLLTPTISNRDPRWLGAWWLGWVILGTAMFLQGILIAFFPKKIRKKTDLEKSLKVDEARLAENDPDKTQFFYIGDKNPQKEKDFLPSLYRLLKNKVLITNILSGVFYILGGSGYMTFMTKNMEVQFYRTSATANLILGPMVLLSMMLGFLVSGYVISKWKPSPVYLFGWNVVVGMVYVISQVSYLYFACPDIDIVGFNQQTKSFSLLRECNRECGCENVQFSPVHLESKGLTYFSACHAGCTSTSKEGLINVYKNCSCVPTDFSTLSTNLTDDYESPEVLRDGYYPVNCGKIYAVFVMLGFIKSFLGSTGKIGNILVNHRAVDPEDKPFAQGLALFFVSLFAFIPGPIIFGYIIDMTCLVWDQTCGKEGSCWYYDRYKFRLYLNLTSAAFTSIGVILDAAVCYYGRNLCLYEDEINTEKVERES